MAKIPKTRKFAISTYLTEEHLKNVLEKNRSIIYRWAYAYHDKDVNEYGSPKEPHTHVWIEFTQPYAVSKPRNMFKGFTDSKGKEINTMIEFQKKTDAHCIQYFIHKGYENKFQYDKSIIQSNNVDVDYLLSLNLDTSDSNDNSYTILSTLVEKGFHYTNLMELAKLYGKDFIYHYKTFHTLAEEIRVQQYREQNQKYLTAIDVETGERIVYGERLDDQQQLEYEEYFNAHMGKVIKPKEINNEDSVRN